MSDRAFIYVFFSVGVRSCVCKTCGASLCFQWSHHRYERERERAREKRESHTHKRGKNTGSSPRGDHEGAVICVLPDTLWPPYRLIFNGSYCTAEGHFCQYSIHVCRNGQVCTVFVCVSSVPVCSVSVFSVLSVSVYCMQTQKHSQI